MFWSSGPLYLSVEGETSLMLLVCLKTTDRSIYRTVTHLNVLNDTRKSECVIIITQVPFTVYKLNVLLKFFMFFMFVKITCKSTFTVVFFVITSSQRSTWDKRRHRNVFLHAYFIINAVLSKDTLLFCRVNSHKHCS